MTYDSNRNQIWVSRTPLKLIELWAQQGKAHSNIQMEALEEHSTTS